MTPKLVANILTMPAIVLLDPLPFTRVGWSTNQDQQKDVARSKLKIVRDNAPNTEEPQSHRIESWAAQQRPLSTAAAHPESARSSLASNVNVAVDDPLPHAGLPDTHPCKYEHSLEHTCFRNAAQRAYERLPIRTSHVNLVGNQSFHRSIDFQIAHVDVRKLYRDHAQLIHPERLTAC